MAFSLTVVLFPGIASAADKITLNCSGTVADPEKFEVTPAPAESFVIDLDNGAVSTSLLGSLSITKRTEDRIDFKAQSGQPGEFTVGSVSRVTGVATVVAWRDDEMLWNYSFKCKRADRLFKGRRFPFGTKRTPSSIILDASIGAAHRVCDANFRPLAVGAPCYEIPNSRM